MNFEFKKFKIDYKILKEVEFISLNNKNAFQQRFIDSNKYKKTRMKKKIISFNIHLMGKILKHLAISQFKPLTRY